MQGAAWEMGSGKYSYVSGDAVGKSTVAAKMQKVVSKIARIAKVFRFD